MKLSEHREHFFDEWRRSEAGNETRYVDTYEGRVSFTLRPTPIGTRVVVGYHKQRHDVLLVGRDPSAAKAWLWPEHMREPVDVEDLDIACDYARVSTVVWPEDP